MKQRTLLILIIAIQFMATQAIGQYHWGISGGTGSSFLIKGDRSFPIENWGVEGQVLPDWMMFAEVKVGGQYKNIESELFIGYKFNGYRLQQSETRPNSLSWTYRNIDQRIRGHSMYVGGNLSPARFKIGQNILALYLKAAGGLMSNQEWMSVEQRQSRFREDESFKYYERSQIKAKNFVGILAREIFINTGVGLKFQNSNPTNRFSILTEFIVHQTVLNNREVNFGNFYEIRVGVGFDFSFRKKGVE